MRPVVPLSVLVGSTLLGVAVGGLLGAELHLDVTVPEAVVERHTLHMAVQAERELDAGRRPDERDVRRVREERRDPRGRRVDADVPRAELQGLDGEVLSGLGRALLHRGPDGAVDGYRLSAIRAGTLPERAGLKNGDIVHAVNGHRLTSVSEAIRAYDALRDAEVLALEITRRGEPLTLSVRVR